MDNVCLVIPVRLDSERFPNKPLELFQGKTLIQNSIDIAKKLDFVDEIVLACSKPSTILFEICQENGIIYFTVDEPVSCGTEKVLAIKRKSTFDMYVTLPVDEPAINPEEINRVFKEGISCITTLYSDFFCEGDLLDHRSCKVVADESQVRYMSRAVIPVNKTGGVTALSSYKKHVGVFFFPEKSIGKHLWIQTHESAIESLEQNMFLKHGLACKKIKHNGFGIDTIDQLSLLEKRMLTN